MPHVNPTLRYLPNKWANRQHFRPSLSANSRLPIPAKLRLGRLGVSSQYFCQHPAMAHFYIEDIRAA
ncbi:hypothetical protein CLOM_g15609 [Closterium sp. NIES-68]|nr:hypothetical protein CLOM_g15609 [Closterium sp. NIES-68]GJP65054.1 hypothetical protein CLOP_g21968 [Closterium sp. NIES-67]GJP68292.1 hypothetical protein CLOP_g25022 [Closterium sp. NIES-67]